MSGKAEKGIARQLIHGAGTPFRWGVEAVTPEVKIQGMERVTKKMTKYAKPIAITMGVLLLIVFIIMCISAAILSQTKKSDNFGDMLFPKAMDAESTGDFDTLQRECEPGLKKCKMKMNGGNGVTYWCSKESDCKIKQLNLTGTLIKEPMYWNTRFA